MNYYLVPQEIVERLNLTKIRKSTPTDMFLLSEYDLAPYGVEKAVSEGAVPISDNMPSAPTAG